MSDITVALPYIGTEAYFSFKDPFDIFIRNKFNLNTSNIKFRVISIISMKDTIRIDLKDPFTEIYEPVGLDEVKYKLDLNDEVPIISLAHTDHDGIERYVRIPLNYISSISDHGGVEYSNRLLVLDLGKLPDDLNLEPLYEDIKDYITTLTGSSVELMDTTVGGVELLPHEEHEDRETIRKNSVSVHKTLTIQLAEVTESRDQILNRLGELGIILG